MGYAQIKERWTPQGCRVITINSVYRKTFEQYGEPTGEILTPVTHIFLEGPDEDGVDKPNEV